MIDNTKEYILCSAIWYDDGITRDDEKKALDEGKERTFPAHFYGATYQNTNITTGYVICQWRHGNIIALRPTNPTYNGGCKTVQGFLTSKGYFVDRWQAAKIAFECGQVSAKEAFSDKYTISFTSIDGNIDKIYINGIEFDINGFMKSAPSDVRFKEENPFNMLFSEDLW